MERTLNFPFFSAINLLEFYFILIKLKVIHQYGEDTKFQKFSGPSRKSNILQKTNTENVVISFNQFLFLMGFMLLNLPTHYRKEIDLTLTKKNYKCNLSGYFREKKKPNRKKNLNRKINEKCRTRAKIKGIYRCTLFSFQLFYIFPYFFETKRQNSPCIQINRFSIVFFFNFLLVFLERKIASASITGLTAQLKN